MNSSAGTTLARFLRDVLFDGRVVLHAPPPAADDPRAAGVLREAYDIRVLSLAGPALPFAEEISLQAGRLLMHAAWYLLNPGLAVAAPEKTLHMLTTPSRPEHHFSADLVLCFLPALHRRARTLLPNDVLPQELERTLREWPLSGVLADIVDPPLTPVDFGTHAGLNFLYAERLAQRPRPSWFPSGLGMQYVELVWQQLGKDVSILPALQKSAQELLPDHGR